jgi:hypothetical protein
MIFQLGDNSSLNKFDIPMIDCATWTVAMREWSFGAHPANAKYVQVVVSFKEYM